MSQGNECVQHHHKKFTKERCLFCNPDYEVQKKYHEELIDQIWDLLWIARRPSENDLTLEHPAKDLEVIA